MSDPDHRAIDGLLREYARSGTGHDEAFIERVMQTLPRKRPSRLSRSLLRAPSRRRWSWLAIVAPLAAAAIVAWIWSLAGSDAGTTATPPPAPGHAVASLPAPDSPAPLRPAPRQPLLTRLGESDAPYGYAAWTPTAYQEQAGRRWPLVVALHGRGEYGDGRATLLSATTRNGPGRMLVEGTAAFDEALVVAPQAPSLWRAPQVDQFITHVCNRWRVDPDRIYLVGVSSGGGVAWWYTMAFGSRLAAIVPFSGSNAPAETPFAHPVACWAIHGAEDEVVPVAWTRGWIGSISGTPAPAGTGTWFLAGSGWRPTPMGEVPATARFVLSIVPGARHDTWTANCRQPALWRWLFAQRRGGH